MSNLSSETVAAAIRQALTSHGPMDEDDLLEALVTDGVDLGTDDDDLFTEALDSGSEVIVGLTDGRYAWLPALLNGRIFTHRLSDLEAEYDMLGWGPDLSPVSVLTESESYRQLVDGSPATDVFPWSDSDALAKRGLSKLDVPDEGALLLAPGRLAAQGFTSGDLVGVQVTDAGFDLTAVNTVEESVAGAAVADLLDERPGHPELLMTLLWTVCAAHDDAFREPSSPLGELLHTSGLEVEGELVAPAGFDFGVERGSFRIGTLISRHDLDLDEAKAVVTALQLYERICDWVDTTFADSDANDWADDGTPSLQLLQRGREATAQTNFGADPQFMEPRDALAFLREPLVVDAFLSEASSDIRFSPITLVLFAHTFEKAAPRAARPAMLWLKGRAHEHAGEIELAEQAFRTAEGLDPSWPMTLLSLARLASDRGDAERGLSLLRRAGALPDAPLVQLLEAFQPTPRPNIGRNERCWCGSGRKYKQCHLHREQLTLADRAAWLYQKATTDLLAGPSTDLLIDLAYERSQFWDDPDALERALSDGFVPDVVLFEGGAFQDFLTLRGSLLPSDEALLAQQWLLVERSVHDVVSVLPGQSITLRDVRTGDVHEVHEPIASKQVKAGELYCARIVPAGGTMQIFGGLEPVSLGDRDHLISLLDNLADPAELVAFLSRRFASPVLKNTEGEPLIFCDATLHVSEPASLTRALDDAYDRDHEAPEDMGVWFEHAMISGMRQVRAELNLHGNEMFLHANSEARFDRTIASLRRLDPGVVIVTESREPVTLADLENPDTSDSKASADLINPSEDPAAAAALEEMMGRYEDAWLDEPIPALSGNTPRQCAEDPTRRPDLIRLLDSFPEDDGRPGLMSPARLRAALGLD